MADSWEDIDDVVPVVVAKKEAAWDDEEVGDPISYSWVGFQLGFVSTLLYAVWFNRNGVHSVISLLGVRARASICPRGGAEALQRKGGEA